MNSLVPEDHGFAPVLQGTNRKASNQEKKNTLIYIAQISIKISTLKVKFLKNLKFQLNIYILNYKNYNDSNKQ